MSFNGFSAVDDEKWGDFEPTTPPLSPSFAPRSPSFAPASPPYSPRSPPIETLPKDLCPPSPLDDDHPRAARQSQVGYGELPPLPSDRREGGGGSISDWHKWVGERTQRAFHGELPPLQPRDLLPPPATPPFPTQPYHTNAPMKDRREP